MKILRKTVMANNITKFEFDVQCYTFLIKNLTGGEILVSFDDFDENSNIEIPAYMSQTITQNVNHSNSYYATNIISVKTLEEGEVEIQCLEY